MDRVTYLGEAREPIEVAEQLGLSRQCVQQAEVRALRALRWAPSRRTVERQREERRRQAER